MASVGEGGVLDGLIGLSACDGLLAFGEHVGETLHFRSGDGYASGTDELKHSDGLAQVLEEFLRFVVETGLLENDGVICDFQDGDVVVADQRLDRAFSRMCLVAIL